jgi:hypothetical protein
LEHVASLSLGGIVLADESAPGCEQFLAAETRDADSIAATRFERG